MKQKIVILIVLLCSFFFPTMVKAEECDISKITISSIEKIDIEGNTNEVEAPTFKNKKIDFNLKMYEVGDSITYDMIIKNDSKEDYMIDENAFKTDSEYIVYTLKTNDGNNVVKANSNKKVTLIVTYKKEVDSSLLNSNKFDASNSLKLSLNTSNKEKKIDTITTDDIKNPLTSSCSIICLIFFILLISTIMIYLSFRNKKKYNKYLIIVLYSIFIPVVYATCKVDIVVNSTIEIEKLPKLFNTVVGLSNNENACVNKYEGEVTDEVGKTVNATNVYFDNCIEQRNVIFGGFCWQVIRTTETGGTKVIYNGEPVNGKCESTRAKHKGIVGAQGTWARIDSEILYGSSFTYDLENNIFKLVDTTSATWSDSTYKNLIGKYTCKNMEDSCTNLYYINGYSSNTSAYISSYTIDNTNYAQIGKSPYNSAYTNPQMVGYMFNEKYPVKKRHAVNSSKFGSTFTYENGTYTITGTTQNVPFFSANTDINNTHYTCWNESGECSTISYVNYITRLSDGYNGYYIEISEGKNISDALSEMLWSDESNHYNSSIKGVIDNWFNKNMINKVSFLEDTVYCNSRKPEFLGGWEPDGGRTDTSMSFNRNNKNTLNCFNSTDQFAVNNDQAKLIYPVGLLTTEEKNNIYYTNVFLLSTGETWWGLTPSGFSGNRAFVYFIVQSSEYVYTYTESSYGVRPVISLANFNLITSGTGSEIDPWIIKE